MMLSDHNSVIYEINDIFVDDLLLRIIYHPTTFFQRSYFINCFYLTNWSQQTFDDELFVLVVTYSDSVKEIKSSSLQALKINSELSVFSEKKSRAQYLIKTVAFVPW